MLSRFWSDFIRPGFAGLAGWLQQFRERWHGYGLYARVLLVFAASRLVVYIGVRIGTLLVRDPAPGKWDAGPEWYHRLARWDSGWYADIIKRGGYRFVDDPSVQTTVSFFPGYPLLSGAVKSLFHLDVYVALLLVANISSVLAILLFAKLVRDELGDEVALSAVALFSFFPSSMFLSAGYTESLCLVFVLLSLILVTQQRFVLSSAIAGLAMATRPTSIVLAPVILLEVWRQNTLPLSRLLPRMVLCGVLAVSGLIAFMIYLGVEFDRPLAFFINQNAWSGQRFRYRLLSAVTTNPFQDLNWRNGGFCLGFLAVMICSFRRLRPVLWLYGIGALAMPYLVLGGFTPSTDRFILMCVPAFMAMALLCRGRPWLANALIGIFAAMLLRKTAMFSQWYWEG